jgi:protein-S-isoprenylcysteine O-methyltransferase Ste14
VRVWGTAVLSGATMVSMSASTERLIVGGPFGLVRHPMYLGDLLIFPSYMTARAGIGAIERERD